MLKEKYNNKYSTGFTIVELIIVVVVIAILATLSIIAYNGIQKSAGQSTIKADLSQAAKQLEISKINNDSYPANATALGKSNGTTYQYTYTSGTESYCLTASNNWGEFHITNSNNIPQDGVCDGHVSINPVIGWSEVATNHYATCAITTNNTTYCWGLASLIGDASAPNMSTPNPINTSGVLMNKALVSLSAGSNHMCGIDQAGKAYCWGISEYGKLGNGSSSTVRDPVAVDTSGVLAGKTLSKISAGEYHTCAIDVGGKAYCWGGDGSFGVLGNNTTAGSYAPVAVDTTGVLAGKTLIDISANLYNSCALDSDGQAYCWGDGGNGKLGNGNTIQFNYPVLVTMPIGKQFAQLASGSEHTCALDTTNSIYCWGQNAQGQIGDNTYTSWFTTPSPLYSGGDANGIQFAEVRIGGNSVCARSDTGSLLCWGQNTYGQGGNNTTGNSLGPLLATNTTSLTFSKIDAGAYHTCGITISAELYCWGYNLFGELGNGTTTNSLTPVLAPFPEAI